MKKGFRILKFKKDKPIFEVRDLSKSFDRLEIIGDKKGFWLKPHKDIEEKLMTMMVWANPYDESDSLGTDLYDNDFKLVKTIKYKQKTILFIQLSKRVPIIQEN